MSDGVMMEVPEVLSSLTSVKLTRLNNSSDKEEVSCTPGTSDTVQYSGTGRRGGEGACRSSRHDGCGLRPRERGVSAGITVGTGQRDKEN